MQSKLQELTEKIYNEGVVKGNEQAGQIVKEAEQKADNIVKDAEAKASQIIKDAEKKAVELNENSQSELKLAARQILNTVKQNITNTITGTVVSEPVKEALQDKAFLKNLVEKIAENWKANDPKSADLNIILPEKDKEQLEKYFKSNTKNLLDQGVHFQFNNGPKSGFQISPKDGGYKISFSEEEFENYFKAYIRPRLVELLFGE